MIGFSNEKGLIDPLVFIKKKKDFPSTVIVTWHPPLARQFLCGKEEKVSVFTDGVQCPVYLLEGKCFAFCTIPAGSPNVAVFMEEFSARGIKNFIFSGSCGILCPDIKDKLIVPSKALRDEGTSYHYTASCEETIEVKNSAFISQFLGPIPHVCSPVWTTDTPYRETKTALNYALSKGCVAVDMECSAIAAVSDYLGVNSYHFMFSGDCFENNIWSIGALADEPKHNVKNILLELAKTVSLKNS